MNRLFIDLYPDEDVNVVVSDLVRARGFRVTATQDTGQIGKSDTEQLESQDQRFGMSREKNGRPSAGNEAD